MECPVVRKEHFRHLLLFAFTRPRRWKIPEKTARGHFDFTDRQTFHVQPSCWVGSIEQALRSGTTSKLYGTFSRWKKLRHSVRGMTTTTLLPTSLILPKMPFLCLFGNCSSTRAILHRIIIFSTTTYEITHYFYRQIQKRCNILIFKSYLYFYFTRVAYKDKVLF